jgi:hypothetical protein
MPGIISSEKAATEILSGLKSKNFIIHFPRSFSRKISLLRWLPDRWFFRIVGKSTGHNLTPAKDGGDAK